MLGTTINLTTEAGGSDLISSVGMISTDFFLQMFVFFRFEVHCDFLQASHACAPLFLDLLLLSKRQSNVSMVA